MAGMSKRGQGRTPEQNREYMREYMKARREGTWHRANNSESAAEMDIRRSAAAYDPQRDSKRFHDSITAVLMGDPPIGQRAIDRGQA